MNIASLIEKLPTERLTGYMDTAIWREAGRRALSWQEAVVERQAVVEASSLLSVLAVSVLKEMLRIYAAVPVNAEHLMKDLQRNTTLSGSECKHGLDELEDAGILFTVSKVWGERIYFLPYDCFTVWQQVLFPLEAAALTSTAREELLNGTFREGCRPLGRQLLSAFTTLARCGLELTSKGVLSKKTIAKIVQAVDFDEQWLQSFDLKWPHREHYSLIAAFVLEVGSAFGLLYMADETLRWDEEKLFAWLTLEEEIRERQLMQWCMELLLPASGSSAHVAAALSTMNDGQWYAVQPILQWLTDNRLGQSGVTANKSYNWYRLLHSFGWLDLVESGERNDEGMLIRWRSPLAAGTNAWYVEGLTNRFISIQPNGEIILEPNCPFTIRWELELIAERVSDEIVTVYRLEMSSVTQSLEYGRTKASIQAFLEASAGGAEIPSAVLDMLDGWTSRACRTAFVEVILLRCDNDQMASFVQNNEAIAALMLEKVGPLDFIVDKQLVKPLRDLLLQTGYPPRKAIQTADKAIEYQYPKPDSVKTELSYVGGALAKAVNPAYSFIYEPFTLQHYELIIKPPQEKVNTAPLWELVPAMWTKQLRVYHHSTRKELIEQALQLQAPVQLRLSRGIRAFVPERLEQLNNSWAVFGLLRDEAECEHIRLTPDMWDEMRLIIPGQPDPL